MKLAQLLSSLSDEDLERLAVEHVRTDERLQRPQLCNFLEVSIRSYSFVREFIGNRQPPTFAMLTLLLNSSGYKLLRAGFREQVMAETSRIAALIDSGELLTRQDHLRLYRRALYEARRDDLDLNSSEAALLALLRQETSVAQVEHFLIEHHQDLREFWERDDSFVHEENALRSGGLVFHHGEQVVIPEEVAPAIWQTLGIDMPIDSARRLFGYLSNSELAGALVGAGAHTSGTKEVRLERIVAEWIQPHVVLRTVGLSTLRDICRDAGASVGGNKEELIDRIIGHFAQRKDQREEEVPEPPRAELRQLDREHFHTLFGSLQHQELTDILRRFPDLRQSGTKELRIETLWQAHLAERTLLGELMSRDLENILQRLGLRLGGSKDERISRLVQHFERKAHPHAPETQPEHFVTPVVAEAPFVSAEVLMAQEAFRQKASNPQVSLQPWLERVIQAPGLVRCYATEDPTPARQLKNKLSQAAAARGGLLVLLLADEAAFSKAREALIERWMTNAEWPKSVACVALAYPLSAPTIEAVIECADSPWPQRLRDRVFPSVRVARAGHGESETDEATLAPTCATCESALPIGARFCPSCGVRVS